jgi:putative protein kinase ArgK-like GTPase of G3E family
VTELWSTIAEHRSFLEEHDRLLLRRTARTRVELQRVLSAIVATRVQTLASGTAYESQVAALVSGVTDPYTAAEALLPA